MILLRELHFTTELTECPECRSQLRAYKTTRKPVKFAGGGYVAIVEHIKQCCTPLDPYIPGVDTQNGGQGLT